MIRHLSPYYLIILVMLVTGACTNPRWMVKDTSTIDPNDYTVLSSREFPSVDRHPTPEDPVLHLQMMSAKTFEYQQKVLMGRYVQDYKIQPVFFTLGALGAVSAFYLANSNSIEQVDGRLETVTLNVVGGLLALSTVFNFKPDGDPRPTGEERFLRSTGTQLKMDTTRVVNSRQEPASINIYYGGQPVSENQEMEINEGRLDITLGPLLSDMEISEPSPDSVRIGVGYEDSTYHFSYPLTSILRPFARVETPVTELRNAPEESVENILAELVEGSQLQIVEEVGKQWYKVLYGISENYVARNDVSLVWRTSDFAKQHEVVTMPSVPFGKIDVESNIPVLNPSNPNGIGLLVGNEDYKAGYSNRKYTDRDLHLLQTYLDEALGYPQTHIHRLENIQNRQPIDSVLAVIGQTATDSSRIVVYLSGYGVLRQQDGAYLPALLLGTGADSVETVNLIQLYRSIARFPSESTVIVNNVDFKQSVNTLSTHQDLSIQGIQQPLSNTAITLTSEHDGLVIISASELPQASHIYLGGGEDKKHYIFPYFFAKGLQQHNTRIGDLFRYLQRNVSYTARKLHDEPQDPVIFGNQSIDLAGE